jgi:hypothetical protein
LPLNQTNSQPRAGELGSWSFTGRRRKRAVERVERRYCQSTSTHDRPVRQPHVSPLPHGNTVQNCTLFGKRSRYSCAVSLVGAGPKASPFVSGETGRPKSPTYYKRSWDCEELASHVTTTATTSFNTCKRFTISQQHGGKGASLAALRKRRLLKTCNGLP